jgi:hypothetical protein
MPVTPVTEVVMRRLVLSALCLLLTLAFSLPALAQSADIGGTWLVTSTIIATTTPTPQIREGFTKQETWVIDQRGGQARLRTPGGQIDGYFAQTHADFPGGAWCFRAQIPNFANQPNLHCGVEVVIPAGTAARLNGSTQITWYRNDAWTGQLVPFGGEAWRFEGLKR